MDDQIEANSHFPELVADEYDATKAYKAGSYAIYNGQLYACMEDAEAGEAITAEKWKTVVVTGQLVSLDEKIEKKELGNGYLTDRIKAALLDCFKHVAWIDESGHEYYDNLEAALYGQQVYKVKVWYYKFSGNIKSIGLRDFGFRGERNFVYDGISGNAYYHKVATEGESETDVLGIYATSIADIPDFSGDFTVSAWHKSLTNKRGHIFTATKYNAGNSTTIPITMHAGTWSNNALASTSNVNYGVKISYVSQKLQILIFFTDGTCICTDLTLPSSIDTTQWHHHALTREDGVIRYFFDGVLIWSVSCDKTVAFPNQVCIGNNFGTTAATATALTQGSYGDYIDDLFVAEYALFTEAFDTATIDYGVESAEAADDVPVPDPDPVPGPDPEPEPDPEPTPEVIATGWLYRFDDTVKSSGNHDFGFKGVRSYAAGVDTKALFHEVASEGEASTDPLGIYATGISDLPDLSGNFTISGWHKSVTPLRGHLFTATKYASGNSSCIPVTTENLAWNIASSGIASNVNRGVKISYVSQKLQIFIFFTDGTCIAANCTLPSSIDTTQWHHHAITRLNGVIRYFFDGVLIWSVACDKTVYFPNQVCIGNNFGTTSGTASVVTQGSYGDYVDDLFVAEFAMWAENFTPSEADYTVDTDAEDPQEEEKVPKKWFYAFDDTIDSTTLHDFGFTGVEKYVEGVNGKAFHHQVATEGTSSTDPLGIYATGITDIPDFSGDFTVSAWHKCATAVRGHIFTATKYASGNATCLSITSEASNWTISPYTTTFANTNRGVKISYVSQKLQVLIYFTDGTCIAVDLTPPSGTVTKDVWHHHAITRKDGVIRYFFDGTLIFSAQCSKTVYFPDQVCIGNNFGASAAGASTPDKGSYSDYVDDLYVAESAMWTNDFDPSEIVYDLEEEEAE